MYHVCILKCKDGSYYTGFTKNLDERIQRHMKGQAHYAKDKPPVGYFGLNSASHFGLTVPVISEY